MRNAALLGCLLAGILVLAFLDPVSGFLLDAGLIAMIACIGVYIGCIMPLEDR